MLSKFRREPNGRKDKKGKKDQGEGQNENFRGSWIEQRPRVKRRQQLEKKERKRKMRDFRGRHYRK